MVGGLEPCLRVYYALLVPLAAAPVTLAAVTLQWFSLKLFKHNS